MTLLAAEALDLGNGKPIHADVCKCFADLIELEGLDNSNNLLHDNMRQFRSDFKLRYR